MLNSSVLNGFRQAGVSPTSVGRLDNQLFIYGSVDFQGVIISSVILGNVLSQNTVTNYNANGALLTSGVSVISGGTGLAMTLAAPTSGCRANILLSSLTSGSVTVTCPMGVTFDGINSIATFSSASSQLEIVYSSSTRWQILYNNLVTFS